MSGKCEHGLTTRECFVCASAKYGKPDDTALQRYRRLRANDDAGSPLERLRFFCSLAMNNQDWLDVEPFFDEMTAKPDDTDVRVRRVMEAADRYARVNFDDGLHKLPLHGRASQAARAELERVVRESLAPPGSSPGSPRPPSPPR